MKIKLRTLNCFATLLFLFSSLPSLHSQILINEYSCSNLTTFLDNFNETEDWIELYNTSAAPVNLNGYYLSDKANKLNKWQFGNVSIPANGFLRIWASDRNINTGANLHTNFTLKQCRGDKIILCNPSLTVIDSLTTLRTQLAHSRGRSPNGSPNWRLFINPTPAASNSTTAYLGYASTPVISLGAGFYAGSQVVTITSPDPGTTIRYTLNGAVPTVTSTLYTGPITINTTQVLSAVAISTNSSIRNSFIAFNTYFINVTHSVNVMSIFGNGLSNLLAGTQSKPAIGLEYFDNNGVFKCEGYGEANKHGNDSWAYAQRGIDFICRDEMGYADELKYQFFNLKTRNSYQRVIIKAAANDNYPFEGQANSNFPGELGGAHIRDQYVHTVSQKARMHLDERTWAPMILYVNGQYWGVYDIREKVDDKDFTKYYYSSKGDSLQFLQTWGGTWSAYGGAQAQTDWNNLKNFITANSMTVPANYNYVNTQLDVKSLADYVILNSYVVCSDWLNWNTAWWRGLNYNCVKKQWRYKLWDEDATFKHYINYTNVPNLNANASPCDPESLGNPGSQGHVPIVNALLQNPEFKQYYVMRYFDLINTGLSCNRMLTILDSMVNVISPEMPRQIQRWGGTMTEWQNNVQALRNFVQARCDSVTKKFNNCYQVTGPYKIKINVDPPNSGTVDFNSLNITNFTWSGTYPGALANNLKAYTKPGYCFSHWTTKNHLLLPSSTSSAVSITLNNNDSVVAHFVPIPNVSIANPSATICQGKTVQLSATGGTNYVWSPSTGLSCVTCSNPVAAPSMTGSIVYTVTAGTPPNCSSSKTQTVYVTPTAYAQFTLVPTQTTALPQTVNALNGSLQSNNTFYWYCTNGAASTATSPSFVLNKPGYYQVTLIAYGANGCNDTTERTIQVLDTAKYYPPYVILPLPNIFSPNGDGVNDQFYPKTRFVPELSCLIFDRWGRKVFELRSETDRWDGSDEKGRECAPGTYFYIFSARDKDGREYNSKGYVQLQR